MPDLRPNHRKTWQFMRTMRYRYRGRARENHVAFCALLDVVRDNFTKQWEQPREVYARVVDDYGALHVRRFWRALAELLRLRKIQHRGRRQTYTSEYRRA